MASEEIRADLLLGRDTLSPGLLKAGEAAGHTSSNVRQLTKDLYELGKQRATPIVDLNDKAAEAKLKDVAAKLKELGAKAASPGIDIKDKDAAAKLAAIQVKLDTLGKKVASPRITLEGLAKAEAQLLALDAQLDGVGKSAAGAAGKSGVGALIGSIGGGLSGGGLIGLAIAAGVIVSPVIASLSFGLGGFALAALGASKNTKLLAQEMAPLKSDVVAFQKQLQPVVVQDFAKAIGVARNLLHGIEPVASATGKALGGMLDQIGAVFASGEWQQFFGFMERTAGPDIQLLTRNFADLLRALPPIVEQLQPAAQALLAITDDVTKLIGALARFNQATDKTAQHENAMAQITDGLRKVLFSPGAGLLAALKLLHIYGNDASKGLDNTAASAIHAHAPVFDLNTAVAALNKSMTTLIGNLLTLQQDNVSWRQSMEAAKKQLDSNSAGLKGNSKDALANKAAVIQSTQAAISFAEHQLTLGKNIGGASRTIQSQISWLEGLHDHSKFTRDEIEALRKEEQKLNQQRINQTINVQGLGHWSVSQSLAPGAGHRRAAGGLIPGTGNADNYPALLTPGEVVVPKGMVSAGAVDHLRGKLPGFASGGIVPDYSGAVAGISPWIRGNDQATIALIDRAVVSATLAGMRAARAAAMPSFGGAGPARHASMPYLEGLWDAAGGPPGLAHLMAAIAMAESGGNPAAYNPSGATGLWQILGAVDPRDQPFLFNPAVNAHEAVLKYRTQGLGAWVTYTSGAYRQFYDNGGILKPGLTLAYNGTGRPEQVIPARSGGAQAIVLEVHGGGSPFEAALAEIIRKYVRVRGGDVQQVLGRN